MILPHLFEEVNGMAKDWSKGFYNSAAWKKERQAVLMRDRYRCTEPGCYRTAQEVHHIKELTEQNVSDPMIALNENNLRSLCSDCHKRITRRMKSKDNMILPDIIFDENGYPIAGSTPPQGMPEKIGVFEDRKPPHHRAD